MTFKVRKLNEVDYISIFNNLTAEEHEMIREQEIFGYPVHGMSAVLSEDRLLSIRSVFQSQWGPVTQSITACCDRDGYIKGSWMYHMDSDNGFLHVTIQDPLPLPHAWDIMHRHFIAIAEGKGL